MERYDDAGNRKFLVPVEMRGYAIEGSISDGDWVRLRGTMKHGTLRATEVENLTTRATVRAAQVPKWIYVIVAVVFGGFFLFLISSCVASAIQNPDLVWG